jgi:hypothetical protein
MEEEYFCTWVLGLFFMNERKMLTDHVLCIGCEIQLDGSSDLSQFARSYKGPARKVLLLCTRLKYNRAIKVS